MTGEEFQAVQKKLGLTNEQMGEAMGIKKRKVTYLRAEVGQIEKVYALAARALFFEVGEKPIR